jgi:SAM-dependent methyltransferase
MTLRERLAAITGRFLAEEARQSECQACSAGELIAFYEVDGVPAQTCVLLDEKAEATSYPLGSILLAYCERCGFIQNVRFAADIVDYSKPTEESQAFSGRFNEFAESLADDLIDRLDLAGKSVLEVGCGKGDFLRLLTDRGTGPALGIDPGFLPNRDEFGPDVEFRRDGYGAADTHLTADFIVTRHLMEHVPNVAEFFGWLGDSARHTDDSVVFTEVPDTARVLREGAFWDIYHEHCSYFTAGALARAIRHAGMSVTRLGDGFDGQYLLAESISGRGGGVLSKEEAPEEVGKMVESFATEADAAIRQWQSVVEKAQSSRDSVAIWGGGSKAVSFLTRLRVQDVTVVDINPHKQGQWLPGLGVQVSPPDVLEGQPPSLVIVMNPIYLDEIRVDLDRMGIAPQLEALS